VTSPKKVVHFFRQFDDVKTEERWMSQIDGFCRIFRLQAVPLDTYFLAGEVTPVERTPDSFAIFMLMEREYITCFLTKTRAEQTMSAYYPLPRLLEQSDIHGFSKIERNLYIVSYGCPMEDVCGHSMNSFLHGRGWEFAHRRRDKMGECSNRVENSGWW
jgi:hypothetical protein